MSKMMMPILLLIALTFSAFGLISTYGLDNFEFFTRAIDDRDKQVDIYAPHTVILSKLNSNGTLVGFFMNSVIGGEGKTFIIAKNITFPYVIVNWR